MATQQRVDAPIRISGQTVAPGDATAGPTWALDLAKVFLSGTGTDQADKCWFDSRSLATSATDALDLQTQTDLNGTALTLLEVRLLAIKNTGTVTINISPNAANGWTAMLTAAADVTALPAGAAIVWLAPKDGAGSAVSATNKVFDVINTSASVIATYEIALVGCSA